MAVKNNTKKEKTAKKVHRIDFFSDMSPEAIQMLISAIKEAEDNESDEVLISLSPGKKHHVKFFSAISCPDTTQMLIHAVKDAKYKQSYEIVIRYPGKGSDLFAEKDSTGEDDNPVTLCANCANLEIWQSRPHSIRQEACSVRNLLVPREIECPSYRMLGERSTEYLCRNCRHLGAWTSSGKEIISEVCSLRHIILPSKQVCEQYSQKATVEGHGQ